MHSCGYCIQIQTKIFESSSGRDDSTPRCVCVWGGGGGRLGFFPGLSLDKKIFRPQPCVKQIFWLHPLKNKSLSCLSIHDKNVCLPSFHEKKMSAFFKILSWIEDRFNICILLTSPPGGGCEVLFSPCLSVCVCVSACVSVCPANILVFYFSAIKRYIDLKFILDTYRIVLNSLKNDLHMSKVKVTGTVHCYITNTET